MTNKLPFVTRGMLLLAALALTACPSGKKCATNADCASGQICSPMSGTCTTGTGGGIGGGLGGGTTGGGTTGGGTGGGTTGGGTGGGTTGGGTGGGTSGGETCEMPEAIQAGTIMGDTTGNMADIDADCTGVDNPGPDHVYSITVPAGQRIDVSVVPGLSDAGVQYDTSVYLIQGPASNCLTDADAGITAACLGGSDHSASAATEDTSYFNTGTAPVNIFIVVDSYYDVDQVGSDGGVSVLASGPYAMTVAFSTPPPDDTCSGPVTITPGTPLTAQTLTGYGDDYNFDNVGMDCSFASDADRVYQVTIPAGQRLTLDATPNGAADLDLALNLVDGAGACGDACVAAADDGFDADPEHLVFTNRTAAAATYLVIVDNWGGTGTFTLSAVLDTPPADEVCSGATPLTAGTPLTNQTTVGYQNDYEFGTNCGSGTLEGDRVYQVSVPNGQRGVVTITPSNADGGTFSPSVALVQGMASQCDVMPRVCTSGVSGATGVHSASWFNTTGMAANVYAIVDSSSSAGGQFSLSYSTAAPATDDVCSTSTTTLAAGVVTGNLNGFYGDYPSGTRCAATSGADRLYRVSVPANQRLTATIQPTGPDAGFDPALNLVNGPAAACDMMHSCAAAGDINGRNAPDTLVFSNIGGAAFDGFLKVSDYNSLTAVTDYSLTTSFAAVPAGEACTLPQTAAAGMLLAQTNVGMSSDTRINTAATGCENRNGDADRVYSVNVPAGQTLTVTVTPPAGLDGGTGSQDVAINIIDGAAATCADVMMCAASADVGFGGATETATFMNSTAGAKTVFVQVVSFPEGLFNVNVQVQ